MDVLMAQMTEEQANKLLLNLLSSLRNTQSSFGSSSAQYTSAQATARDFLTAMKRRGWLTSLSGGPALASAPVSSGAAGRAGADVDMHVDDAGPAPAVEGAGYDHLMEDLVAGMRGL